MLSLSKWHCRTALLFLLSFSRYSSIVILIHNLAKPYTIWRNYRLSPNCIQLSSYPHFSTTFADKILYLSAKNRNILFLFTYNSGNPWLLPKSILLPKCINRHVNSGIKKPKKERPTNYPGEPPYARNPLISSHFLILSPNRSKFLWHQFWIAAWAAVRYCSHKFSKTQRGHAGQ